MSKCKKYRIKQKDFRKLGKIVERAYYAATVIYYFCRAQQKIQELYNIVSIIGNLGQDTDIENAYFINYPNNNFK